MKKKITPQGGDTLYTVENMTFGILKMNLSFDYFTSKFLLKTELKK